MRARLLAASLVSLVGFVLLFGLAEGWDPCGPGPCRPPPAWVSWVWAAAFALLAASAVALLGALFPLRAEKRRVVALTSLAALTLALVAGLGLGSHSTTCYGSSESAMVCTESYPLWIANTLGFTAAFGGIFGVAGLVHCVLASPAGSPSRRAGARVALAVLAAVLLVPAVSVLGWWTNAPEGTTWTVEGGQLCARWSVGRGGGESCRTVGSVGALPLALAAGGGAILQAGRPSWRWAGRGAVALTALAAAVILVGNAMSPVKSDWMSLALVAVGIGAAVWMIEGARADG